ncbi:MAG: TPR end-of-group domain-containing protein [Pirellulaceae bacterium]
MNSYTGSLKRRLIREAEGFLELATLFEDRFTLEPSDKTALADQCLATLSRISDPGSRLSQIRYLEGQAHRLATRYPKAIASLLEAWELDSSNMHTCLALAWCYKRQAQLELAVAAMQDALELEPESGLAHYNLACYLALLQRAKPALEHLSTAIEIEPSFRFLAADETDFDPIRSDPEFRTLAILEL